MFIHWGNKLRVPPNAVRVAMPPALSPRGSDTSACHCVWLGPVGVLYQALEARQRIGGKKKNKNIKKWNRVTATMVLSPHANSKLHLGTSSHLAPWNKPIHGLIIIIMSRFVTVSLVLPTRANTFDRSCHFDSGTFLNGRHYCDVW